MDRKIDPYVGLIQTGLEVERSLVDIPTIKAKRTLEPNRLWGSIYIDRRVPAGSAALTLAS